MAATESDPAGASPQLQRPRPRLRMTLRLRLTLLYGACFLVAGAGLLGITYALFKHSQSGQSKVAFSGATVRAPSGAQIRKTASGPVLVTRTPNGKVTTTALPAGKQAKQVKVGILTQFKQSAQEQINQVVERARGRLVSQRAGSASSLLTYSAITLAGMALLSILLGWLLAGRALRPLRTMNARAREITEESLHERLGVEGRRDELGELAGTFDGLLARLERAFESQRRFVTNASHELRTPVTLERTLLEVALADPNVSVESLRAACERVLAGTEQQERLIEALLTLARSQGEPGRREQVELAALSEQVLVEHEALLDGVELETDLEPARILADPVLVERLIANLVENAIVHNAATAPWVRVETAEEEGTAVIRVANSGAEVPEDEIEPLFEPFHRLAGDRTADQRGLGLGLSIVRAIATAHGATASATPRAGGGLTVELRFVAVPAPIESGGSIAPA